MTVLTTSIWPHGVPAASACLVVHHQSTIVLTSHQMSYLKTSQFQRRFLHTDLVFILLFIYCFNFNVFF